MLEVGEKVRYASIGAGKVVRHEERKFQGSERIFAVVFFPHKNMDVHLLVGDKKTLDKISKVYSKTKLKAELRRLEDIAETLPRTWDIREQTGDQVIGSGDPSEWIKLLASYAYAEGAGVSVAASDADIVRSLKELVSAELACADHMEHDEASDYVDAAYNRVVKRIGKRGLETEHFAGVEIDA